MAFTLCAIIIGAVCAITTMSSRGACRAPCPHMRRRGRAIPVRKIHAARLAALAQDVNEASAKVHALENNTTNVTPTVEAPADDTMPHVLPAASEGTSKAAVTAPVLPTGAKTTSDHDDTATSTKATRNHHTTTEATNRHHATNCATTEATRNHTAATSTTEATDSHLNTSTNTEATDSHHASTQATHDHASSTAAAIEATTENATTPCLSLELPFHSATSDDHTTTSTTTETTHSHTAGNATTEATRNHHAASAEATHDHANSAAAEATISTKPKGQLVAAAIVTAAATAHTDTTHTASSADQGQAKPAVLEIPTHDALGLGVISPLKACREKTIICFGFDLNDAWLAEKLLLKDLVGADRFVKDRPQRPITRRDIIIGGDLPEDEEAESLMCNPTFNATPAPLDAVSLTEATKPGPTAAAGGSLRAPSCAAPRAITTKPPAAPGSSAAGKPRASKAKQAAAPRKPPVKPQPATPAKASGTPTGSPTTARAHQPANSTARQTTNSQERPGCAGGSWGSDGRRVRLGGSALPKPKSLSQPLIPVGRAHGSRSSSSSSNSSRGASKRAAAASPGCSSESAASRRSTDSWGSRRSSQSSNCSCSTGGGSGSTGRIGAGGGSSKKRVSPPVAALQRPKIAVGRFSLVNPAAGAVSSRAKGSLRGSHAFACAASLAELDGAWMWICNDDGSMRSGKALL